jgi:GT2 family glycosyltransferase
MHVAVCIVGFRNSDDIVTCLDGLIASSYEHFEVVVCENGGEAAYQTLLERAPCILPSGQSVTLICAPSNPGYAGGVNLCMDATPAADAWWILNPDTKPDPDALLRLCARLSIGDCQAVGCTVHSAGGTVESRGGRWNPWFARAVSIDHGVPVAEPSIHAQTRLDYLSGASMLVGRAFVARVGRMREDYFLYGEEVEWCLRGVALGARLGLANDANVMHLQGTTTGSVSEVSQRSRIAVYLDERNKLLITRDRFPHLLLVAAAGALTMLLMRFARRGAWAQLGYALDGWWSGLGNQRGKPVWI